MTEHTTTTLRCDLCDEDIRPEDMRYSVERFDSLDACTAECLAALAVGEAHMRGERDAYEAAARRTVAPRKRWWQR